MALPNNILHLSEYQVCGAKEEEHDLHFQIEHPDPIACHAVHAGRRALPELPLPLYPDQPRRAPPAGSATWPPAGGGDKASHEHNRPPQGGDRQHRTCGIPTAAPSMHNYPLRLKKLYYVISLLIRRVSFLCVADKL